ncbi:MAG: alanine racemase [Chloroflexi bacterium]|nr:alanine racemase [Chloroflexota bacterium]MCI0829006.1 alanine racemase [Chloroflexota bacterium]MCI0863636.1 alanine racemase [Chloroflexota bacterium]
MEEIYRPTPGTLMEDLDTPCLVIDMDDLDHNMDVIADTYEGRSAKLRGHAKNHKTPAIAHRQIRRGGTVGGVCAAKVSEAEVMVHGGIPSVFITSEIVASMKIDRLCSLAGQAEMLVACDQAANARDLSKAATARGVELGVVIELETGLRRCGVREIDAGVALAKEIVSLPGLRFRGVMSHQVIPDMPDREDRAVEAARTIKGVIDLKDAIESEGIQIDIVSTGETWSYDVAAEIPGVTEIQGGSYLMMETHYSYMTEFHYAGKILTTIISAPRPGVAIGDAGIRAISSISGMPEVFDRPGVTVESMDSDHAVFKVEPGASLKIGDQVLLIPAQQDAMVSRWDRFIGLRKGKVEVVWDILARGCHN